MMYELRFAKYSTGPLNVKIVLYALIEFFNKLLAKWNLLKSHFKFVLASLIFKVPAINKGHYEIDLIKTEA